MSNERILIIEDEDDIAEVMRYNLDREGFRVRTAASGAVGLERVLREGADLVLLDLMLPDLDGIEFCRRLRQHPGTIDVPVIMVTARGEEEDVILGLGIGADDYIPKPFSPKELV
ncbi:MAG: response regulator, partial [Planctomycetota bacterium]